MMCNYIQLNRKFSLFTPTSDDSEMYAFGQNNRALIGWEELLKKDRVIILAEAGTGKTEELKEVAKRLCKNGKPSFFCRLEELLESDLPSSFDYDAGDEDDFDAWNTDDNNAIGYFFLDSIDEAKLSNRNAFRKVLQKFVSAIGKKNLSRAKIFITSRFTEWQAKTDLKTFCDKLEIEKKEELVYRLESFDDEQIKMFSSHKKVPNPHEFVNAIESADARIFAQRPQDLIGLIKYWKDKGKLGRHIEILEYSVEEKLQDKNQYRSDNQRAELSPEEAHFGAKKVAASVTFMRKSKICTINPSTETDFDCINSEKIFSEWDKSKVEVLLSRPIFDEAIYGAVRFHHRSVREFLTAQWLYDLLSKSGARSATESLIFNEKYGRKVVMPSMQAIGAWLSCWDEKIRKKIQVIAPEVLVEKGDPSEFDLEFRIDLLDSLIDQYKDQNNTDLQIDPVMMKRLATPDMGENINRWLNKHSHQHDLCILFLNMIRYGQVKGSVSEAIKIAQSPKYIESIRVTAFQAVLAVGTDAQKKNLIQSLFEQDSVGKKMIGSECAQLFPDLLSVDELISIIKEYPEEDGIGYWPRSDEYPWPHIRFQLDLIARVTLSKDQITSLLEKLYELVLLEPYRKDSFHNCLISKEYGWVALYAVMIANQLLEKKDDFCFEEKILDIFWAKLEADRCPNRIMGYSFTDPNAELFKLAKNWRGFSFKLMWHLVNKSQPQISSWQHKHLTTISSTPFYFWSLQVKDWDQLVTKFEQTTKTNVKKIILDMLLYLYKENNLNGKLPFLKKLVSSFIRDFTMFEYGISQFEELKGVWRPQIDDWNHIVNELNKEMGKDKIKTSNFGRRYPSSAGEKPLNVLIYLYKEYDTSNDRLAMLRELTNGSNHLKHHLEERLNPENKVINTFHGLFSTNFSDKLDNHLKEERKTKALELKKDSEYLKNISTPSDDKEWKDLMYLYKSIHPKEPSVLDICDWNSLIPEFGNTVAENFKKGSVNFWRTYNEPHTVDSVKIGLAGIAMEIEDLPTEDSWIDTLSKTEATKATMYVILNACVDSRPNMNLLSPLWLPCLQRGFPEQVNNIILDGIKAELTEEDWLKYCHSCRPINFLRYDRCLDKSQLQEKLIDLLSSEERFQKIAYKYGKERQRIVSIITIILEEYLSNNNSYSKNSLVSLAKSAIIKSESLDVALQWLHILFIVDAGIAFEITKSWVSHLYGGINRKELVISIFSVLGSNNFRFKNSIYVDYWNENILKDLVTLFFQNERYLFDENIRSSSDTQTKVSLPVEKNTSSDDNDKEEDYYYKGNYSLSSAQAAHKEMVNTLLSRKEGDKVYLDLIFWSKIAIQPSKDKLLKLAKERAETESEFTAWDEKDINKFSENAFKDPSTEEELFKVAIQRLLELKDDFENGDDSPAQTVKRAQKETELRTFLARDLRQASRGQYEIAQEEEFTDGKKTDIRFRKQGITPLPCELKIADKWSFTQLEERLENQLIQQYMKKSKYGIFLLVYRDVKEKQHWNNGKKIDFKELLKALQICADSLVKKDTHVEKVEVIGIDLNKRHS